MRFILISVLIILGLYLIDRTFLWFEKKGWIYWRRKKPDVGGGIGNAMQQLHLFLNPSAQYTIQAKQKVSKETEADDKK